MNFGYYAHEEEEGTKGSSKHVDHVYIAGKPTVQREAIPTYFAYEPCEATEEQEDGGVKSTAVDPAFIAVTTHNPLTGNNKSIFHNLLCS